MEWLARVKSRAPFVQRAGQLALASSGSPQVLWGPYMRLRRLAELR